MIGNDVIDLALASKESDWSRPRFRQKVFTPDENSMLDESVNANRLAWQMWSMKESAYKAYTRMVPQRIFNPKRMECSMISEEKGIVTIASKRFYTTSVFAEKSIMTSAVIQEGKPLSCVQFSRNYSQDESTDCRLRVLSACSKILKIAVERIQIIKSEIGIPHLYLDNEPSELIISMSHHGRFGAYAISK